MTLSSKHGSEEAYCDGFLDVVESEGVVSAGCEAAGRNDYHERLGELIYCSEGRNKRSLILCKASNSHLTTQILILWSKSFVTTLSKWETGPDYVICRAILSNNTLVSRESLRLT